MKSKEEIQSVINRCKRSGDFKRLRIYLRKLLADMQNEYYLLAELSSACYQLGKYDEALTHAHKAYDIAPTDYWVRYIYGCALTANDKLEEAAELFDSIIACDVMFLANYEHGEGKRWADSLLNDSLYMRAVVFQQEGCSIEARDMFLRHKSLRRRGLYSDFSIRQVDNHIRTLDVNISDGKMDYSISKYCPEFYTKGDYIKNEWTSVSEIGKSFDDDVLTSTEYLRIEQCYINTAIELALKSGCSYLIIDYLEGEPHDIILEIKKNPINRNLIDAAKNIRLGLRVHISQCADYLRLCLRECCYATFSNHAHNFYVDFGYDFYMHVHTELPKLQVENIVKTNNLFIRP